jgi:hypothetical protein
LFTIAFVPPPALSSSTDTHNNKKLAINTPRGFVEYEILALPLLSLALWMISEAVSKVFCYAAECASSKAMRKSIEVFAILRQDRGTCS